MVLATLLHMTFFLRWRLLLNNNHGGVCIKNESRAPKVAAYATVPLSLEPTLEQQSQ